MEKCESPPLTRLAPKTGSQARTVLSPSGTKASFHQESSFDGKGGRRGQATAQCTRSTRDSRAWTSQMGSLLGVRPWLWGAEANPDSRGPGAHPQARTLARDPGRASSGSHPANPVTRDRESTSPPSGDCPFPLSSDSRRLGNAVTSSCATDGLPDARPGEAEFGCQARDPPWLLPLVLVKARAGHEGREGR